LKSLMGRRSVPAVLRAQGVQKYAVTVKPDTAGNDENRDPGQDDPPAVKYVVGRGTEDSALAVVMHCGFDLLGHGSSIGETELRSLP